MTLRTSAVDLAVVVVAAMLASGCGERTGADDVSATAVEERADCQRPAAVEWSAGAARTARAWESFVGELDAEPTGVVLRAPDSDSISGPADGALRLMDGSFVTAARPTGLGLVLRWDSAGALVGRWGRRGMGPGEFAGAGTLGLFLGSADSIYVLDDANRLAVFTPNGEFVRVVGARYAGRDPRTMHVARGGRFVTTGYVVAGRTGNSIHVMATDAALDTSFAPLAEDLPRQLRGRVERVSAYDGNERVWVAPPANVPGGLVLEAWSLSGVRERTIRRVAPWAPEGGHPPTDDRTEPVLPRVISLAIDERGLLWMTMLVRDQRWRAVDATARGDLFSELYDVRVEVVDPDAAEVLASFRIDVPDDEHLPPFVSILPRTSLAYTVEQDSLGFSQMTIHKLVLRQAAGATSR